MGNLIRLLLALPPDDLRAIAERWGVQAEPEQRPLVASLYHEMTSEWPVKTIWDGLDPDQRVILQFILNQRGFSASKHLLLHELPFDAARLHHRTGALGQLGVVGFRSGQHDYGFRDHPPGGGAETWHAYVPFDLGRVLGDVQQQAEQGDRSARTLRKMLVGHELGQLVHLATHWGVQQPERLFKRELVGMLEELLTDRSTVHQQLGLVTGDSPRLYTAIVEAGGRLPLREAQHRVELDDSQMRAAFKALNEFFLVHETYLDGQRILYVPGEVLRGEQPEEMPAMLPALSTLGRPPIAVPTEPMFLHDLQALLEKMASHRVRVRTRHYTSYVPGGVTETVAFTPEFAKLARECCVQHYAIRLGLVEVHDGALDATSLVRDWDALPDRERLSAALQVWLTEDRCSCLQSGEHLKPSVPLPTLRRLLADALREAQPGAWYSVNSLVRRLRAQLRPSASNATYPDLRLATVLSIAGLCWLGVVSLGLSNDGKAIAAQIDEAAQVMLPDTVSSLARSTQPATAGPVKVSCRYG